MVRRDATTPTATLDWIVFAEDWGSHPSTTQHLVAHLPPDDRVLWVDSIGMRSPRPSPRDAARVLGRLRRTLAPRHAPASVAGRAPDRVVRPPFLPWHGEPWCRALNARLIGSAIARQAARLGLERAVLLTANPIVAHYLEALAPSVVIYLRLDDFGALPGVDRALIVAGERVLHARADLVVAPNAALLPSDARRAELIPQGVDVERFAAVPLDPPDTRVIGYWGAIEEWLDYDLIARVARRAPDWTFEMLGRAQPEALRALRSLGNVRVLDPVPHPRLAEVAAGWRGAWAPYRPDRHLLHASPLKLREYLAAGFPTASAPIPESRTLPDVTLVADADQALEWLRTEVMADTREARTARRARQQDAGWDGRARTLRRLALELLVARGPRR